MTDKGVPLRIFLQLVATIAALTVSTSVQATEVPAPGSDTPADEARRWFTEDPDAPMIAPKGYDVTIVEYMDYQCPSCRATVGPLKQFLAKDKKVRVIFRDWPICGAASEKAARLALASKYQGKYVAFHEALFATARPLTDAKIEAAAKKAGVDWDRLLEDKKLHSKDIEELLARNDAQANMLGLDGTPGFIIGNTKSFGGMTLNDLEESVANARRKSAVAAKEESGR